MYKRKKNIQLFELAVINVVGVPISRNVVTKIGEKN